METVISGGQTGADRAALDAAISRGFSCGGFCPKGRIAEDGVIGQQYPLIEISGGYRQRTKENIIRSSGTVIFYKYRPSGGTELTIFLAIKHHCPYLLIDISTVSEDMAIQLLRKFIKQREFSILNVAGPRQSSCPEIYNYVYKVIHTVIHISG